MQTKSTTSSGPCISERLKPIAPSATLAITAKAKELRAQGKPVINFAAGEPDFGLPGTVKGAMSEALEQGFTRYTPTSGTPELKKAVAAKFKRDQGLEILPTEVVISCGAKHSLYNLMQVLVNPGEDVLIPKPYWVSYPEMVRLAGGCPVEVETSGNQFLMTADLIEKAITPKSRVVVLNSPSNPTGAVLGGEQLEKIAALAERHGLFILSDEIYEYYIYDGRQQATIASYFKNWRDHTAIVNGASKSYAMTGLRIGYTAAREDLVKKIGVLQDHSTSNPVSISQKGTIAALSLGEDYISNLKTTFERRRDLVVKGIEAIDNLSLLNPSGAFYAFVSVEKTGMSPADFCRRLLEEKFVAAIPGEGFGSGTHIRISFACSESDINEGLKRIKDFLKF